MFYTQTLKAIEIATRNDKSNHAFILKNCIRENLSMSQEAYSLTQTDMLYPAILLDEARAYIDQFAEG